MRATLFEQQLREAHRPLTISELDRLGVSRGIRDVPKWQRTSRGFYTRAGREESTAQRILDQLRSVPEGGALAGWAAAFVHGVDWLDGRGIDGRHLPVSLCVGPDVRRRSTERLTYTRAQLSPTDRQVRFGLSVTSPMRTALDCARWAVDLEEAVVVLDALAHFDLVNLSGFAQYVADSPRVVGIRQVRQALTHATEGVRSPWESRLRMVAVLEAGLPRLLVNPAVYDDRGRFVAIPDLLDVEAGLVLEYDGSGHRERRQHNADNAREEALERVGLTVVRADSLDYRHRRAQLVSRLRDGRRRGLDRDRRRDHWTLASPAWALDPYASLTDEDKEALFGNSGRASAGF